MQKEQLTKECEIDQKELSQMREKIQQLQLKLAEGKLKDVLIVSLQTSALNSDIHIKDLQEALVRERNQIDLNASIFRHYKDQLNKNCTHFAANSEQNKSSEDKALNECHDELKIQNETISELREQMKSRDATLTEVQSVIREEKIQLHVQNQTIADNNATISNLLAQIESQNARLRENEENLSKLQKQIEKFQRIQNSCRAVSDSNSIHNVEMPNFDTFPVLCNSEIAGPGWTVIQQRINGEESFSRDWETYKNGFGNFSGDFFLGLEKIHRLTNDQPHELYIYLETFDRESIYARYDNFSVAGEEDKYRLLSLGSFSGNSIADKMSYHVDQKFSTFDSDNDGLEDGHCAKQYNTGWWYKACGNW